MTCSSQHACNDNQRRRYRPQVNRPSTVLVGPAHDRLTSLVMSSGTLSWITMVSRRLSPVAMASHTLSPSYECASTPDRTPSRQLVANEPTSDGHRDGRYQLRYRHPPNPRLATMHSIERKGSKNNEGWDPLARSHPKLSISGESPNRDHRSHEQAQTQRCPQRRHGYPPEAPPAQAMAYAQPVARER
jgi:hypothetical protein